jgi:hypothetical protein
VVFIGGVHHTNVTEIALSRFQGRKHAPGFGSGNSRRDFSRARLLSFIQLADRRNSPDALRRISQSTLDIYKPRLRATRLSAMRPFRHRDQQYATTTWRGSRASLWRVGWKKEDLLDHIRSLQDRYKFITPEATDHSVYSSRYRKPRVWRIELDTVRELELKDIDSLGIDLGHDIGNPGGASTKGLPPPIFLSVTSFLCA